MSTTFFEKPPQTFSAFPCRTLESLQRDSLNAKRSHHQPPLAQPSLRSSPETNLRPLHL